MFSFIFTGLALYFTFLYYIGFACWRQSLGAQRKQQLLGKLGIWTLFYYVIPLFPFIHYYVIVNIRIWYKNNISVKLIANKRAKEMAKLLSENEQIKIMEILIESREFLIPTTLETKIQKTAIIGYIYVNSELNDYYDPNKVICVGDLAVKMESFVGKVLYMTETELKLLILNNQLDNITGFKYE